MFFSRTHLQRDSVSPIMDRVLFVVGKTNRAPFLQGTRVAFFPGKKTVFFRIEVPIYTLIFIYKSQKITKAAFNMSFPLVFVHQHAVKTKME